MTDGTPERHALRGWLARLLRATRRARAAATVAVPLMTSPWATGCGGRTGLPSGSGSSVSDTCNPTAGTPVTLATDPNEPVAVVLDARNAYWADRGTVASGFNDGAIERTALCGGGVVTLAAQQPWAGALAVDATAVYWANVGGMQSGAQGAIMKVSIDGGSPTTLASDQDGPSTIAVDSTSVYWATLTAIVKCPLDGGAVTTLASGQSPSSMVIDDTSVYWSNAPPASTLMTVPLGGGVATTLISGPMVDYTGIGSIAVDSTRLYWSTSDAYLMAAALDGTHVVTLASQQYVGTNLVSDSTSLYWANGGNVMRFSLATNAVGTLVAQGGIAIALNASLVAWTDPGFGDNGSILVVPK
jgi:hypothetical protein